MSFIRLSKITLTVSALAVLVSLILLIGVGPKFSIEFTGGTLMQLRLPEGKTKTDLEQEVKKYDPDATKLGQITVTSIRDVNGTSVLLRMRPITNEEHKALLADLQKSFKDAKELQFTTIGPSVSASLKQKSAIAIAVASIALIVYMSMAFSKMPKRLSPWKFGVLAVIAFLHDIIITAGIFVVISRFTSFEVDTLFITALLTILAYSANDTIVIFDRIRANVMTENRSEDLSTLVARGLRQCVTRTTNTMMASLIMLFSLFFLGSDSIRWFILALIIGTFVGTYSSYFVAAPLLVFWRTKR